jgi:integrase
MGPGGPPNRPEPSCSAPSSAAATSPPDKTTVAKYLRGQWLPATQTRVRPGTWVEYQRKVDTHLIPTLGAGPAPASHHRHAQRPLPAAPDPRHRRPHRPVRACHHPQSPQRRRPLGAAGPQPGPARRPTHPRRSELQTWTAEELRRFLDSVRDDRLFAAWRLAALTGMRRGEVLGLRWADLDLEGGWLAVRQTLVVVANHPQLSRPKTTRGRRQLALDPSTVAALRSHRRIQAAERLAAGPAWTTNDLVFTRQDGTPLHPEYVRRLFDQYLRRAGLPRIRFHDPRHTHATLALQAGVHPKVVSERLGHTTVAMTLDTYSHTIPALQQDAVTTVASLVNGATLIEEA